MRTPNEPARDDGERGSSAIEFAGMLPLLLLVALGAVQLGVAGYAVQQAGTGARAAARVAGQDDAGGYAGAGRAAMSGWTADGAAFSLTRGGDAVTVTASVTIPSLIPGIDGFGTATRTVTMPRDRDAGGPP